MLNDIAVCIVASRASAVHAPNPTSQNIAPDGVPRADVLSFVARPMTDLAAVASPSMRRR
jgi:hypothetical protein